MGKFLTNCKLNYSITILIYYAEKKEKKLLGNEADQQLYGPATNCNELGKLGYTLNGYYLIGGKEQFQRIKTVYYINFNNRLDLIEVCSFFFK